MLVVPTAQTVLVRCQAIIIWAFRVAAGFSESSSYLCAEFLGVLQACLHFGLGLLKDAQLFTQGVLLLYSQLVANLLHFLQLVLYHLLGSGQDACHLGLTQLSSVLQSEVVVFLQL